MLFPEIATSIYIYGCNTTHDSTTSSLLSSNLPTSCAARSRSPCAGKFLLASYFLTHTRVRVIFATSSCNRATIDSIPTSSLSATSYHATTMSVCSDLPTRTVGLNMVYNVQPSGISASSYVAGSERVILKAVDTFCVSSSETGMRRLGIDSSSEQNPSYSGGRLSHLRRGIHWFTAPLTRHYFEDLLTH